MDMVDFNDPKVIKQKQDDAYLEDLVLQLMDVYPEIMENDAPLHDMFIKDGHAVTVMNGDAKAHSMWFKYHDVKDGEYATDKNAKLKVRVKLQLQPVGDNEVVVFNGDIYYCSSHQGLVQSCNKEDADVEFLLVQMAKLLMQIEA